MAQATSAASSRASARTQELGDVVLFDIAAKENFAKGKALDLEQNSAILGYDVEHHGHVQAGPTSQGADVLIVTAGIPRKPGQSRDDLVATNLPIIRDVANNAKKHCPNAFVIVISNPLDAMVYEYKRVHRLRRRAWSRAWPACSTRARFQLFLAREAERERQGRPRDGARRPRRRHGPGPLDDDHQRRPRDRR